MSVYKFSYFDVTAKGETARTLFALAKVKFEDVRIDDDVWPKLKPNTPFGQVPTLEVDGITLCQSKAIERFLAKRFGVYGSSDLDQAKADMIIDCSEEIRTLLIDYVFYTHEDKKEEVKKSFLEEKGPRMIGNLDKMVNPTGHFVGDKISWPDIDFYNVIDFTRNSAKLDIATTLSKHPTLQKLLENVENNPNIADWLKNRPKTEY